MLMRLPPLAGGVGIHLVRFVVMLVTLELARCLLGMPARVRQPYEPDPLRG